jgi:hypothetical protein
MLGKKGWCNYLGRYVLDVKRFRELIIKTDSISDPSEEFIKFNKLFTLLIEGQIIPETLMVPIEDWDWLQEVLYQIESVEYNDEKPSKLVQEIYQYSKQSDIGDILYQYLHNRMSAQPPTDSRIYI